MTPERWRQIEDICHAGLARPAEERAAFLAQACAGDDGLQREVESLLAQESSVEGFMSVPAVAVAGSAGLDHAIGTLVGRRLGSYSIRSLLGVGGMGEVYRAHDDTLGREVALKVLPPAFTADRERRARLEREARMLATLNHPHIGAIYGVEDVDGRRALVLELVEGETLAERIAQRVGPAARGDALPVPDALAIAQQIADALDAAHEKGIVHRDLKPANIKITPDGVVKVLDFGLAKAASVDGSDPGLMHSRDGAILGTAAYMSPEQARGRSVDKRADIWAFGCVLYEMLTGRLAFAGDTVSDTIAKILERDPDWTVLPTATPARIRRLLLRCLTKDPKQRLRDIAEARIAIDTIDDELPGASDMMMMRPAPTWSATRWLPWVALAVLAAGVALREARRPAIFLETPLANARFTRFTDWEGTEASAEISPDGKFVVFLADHAGEFDLWLSQVGTGSPVNLTKDIGPLAPPTDILRSFGFSGDGQEIWFSLSGKMEDAKVRMSLTGGPPRPFLVKGTQAPSWSPDGTRLAYFLDGDGDHLFVADRTGADAKPISMPQEMYEKGLHNHNPVWSPDGQWIYFVHGLDFTVEMDIWRVRPSGGSPERLTEHHAVVNFLAPLDARTLLYVSRTEDRSGPWLWALDVESKVTSRTTVGLERYTSVSASRDGRRVVATAGDPSASLWRVPLLDRQAEDRDVRPYPMPTARALAPRFDGTSLFYLSAQGAGDGLWQARDGQASEVWKSVQGALSGPPAVSPDGKRVAVVVTKGGKRRLVVMATDGTNAQTLAASIDIQGAADQSAADWSLDGTWIVAGGRDATGAGLFKIPVDGGAPVPFIRGQATNPVRSPSGNLILYVGPNVGGQAELLGLRPDAARVDLPEVLVRPGSYRFLPDGTGVVFLPKESRDFWLLDLATHKTRPLTRLSNHGAVRTFDITPDGTAIVFDRSRENSDIVLIDLPK